MWQAIPITARTKVTGLKMAWHIRGLWCHDNIFLIANSGHLSLFSDNVCRTWPEMADLIMEVEVDGHLLSYNLFIKAWLLIFFSNIRSNYLGSLCSTLLMKSGEGDVSHIWALGGAANGPASWSRLSMTLIANSLSNPQFFFVFTLAPFLGFSLIILTQFYHFLERREFLKYPL